MSHNVSKRTKKLFPEHVKPVIRRRQGASIVLSNAALAEQCFLELNAYRRGEPCNQANGLELFRRVIVEGDSEAREWIQRSFGEIVSNAFSNASFMEVKT